MAEESLASGLQQSVLALLCFDDKHGTEIAVQVKAEYFDSPYRDLVDRVLRYRRKYGSPPGVNHLEDLISQTPQAGKRGEARVRETAQVLEAELEDMNTAYVTSRVQDFVAAQQLKRAVMEAGDRYRSGPQEGLVEDVHGILQKALRYRVESLSVGTRLNDPTALSFLNEEDNISYPLGIDELDRLSLGPTPKELLLLIGPKGTGKSWFCVHVGKQALLQRLRVLHITLEMSEKRVVQRYYQSLFSVAKRPDKVSRTVLEFDDLQRLSGFRVTRRTPRLDFRMPKIRKLLKDKMRPFGTRFANLVIKEFPSGTLTVTQLAMYLDYLGAVEKFVPHVMIVDYPDLMRQGRGDEYRHTMEQTFVDLRGIGGERHIAVVTPTQGGRQTIGARHTRSKDVSESIGKVLTADTVLTYQRTAAEERLNLGRLRVEHARNEEGGLTVVLAQSYATGQYVTQSALMQNAYWEQLRRETGPDENSE